MFPLHKGKYKKGMIPDSTQEEVDSKAAKQQNTNKNVMDKPDFVMREKKMSLAEAKELAKIKTKFVKAKKPKKEEKDGKKDKKKKKN